MAVLLILTACSSRPPLIHSFRPELAHDYNVGLSSDPQIAVMLLPDRVTMFIDPAVLVRAKRFSGRPRQGDLHRTGPHLLRARQVCLPALKVPSSTLEHHEIAVNFSLEAGGRYELQVRETREGFHWQVVKLSAESYRRLDPPVVAPRSRAPSLKPYE